MAPQVAITQSMQPGFMSLSIMSWSERKRVTKLMQRDVNRRREHRPFKLSILQYELYQSKKVVCAW